MPLSSKIKPDFSSRGPAPPLPPSIAGRVAPPEKQPPKGDGKPFDYNVKPNIPEFKGERVPLVVKQQPVQAQSLVSSAPIPMSQFSPSIETYPTAGNSYFLSQADISNAVSEWAGYPAITNVRMDGHNI